MNPKSFLVLSCLLFCVDSKQGKRSLKDYLGNLVKRLHYHVEKGETQRFFDHVLAETETHVNHVSNHVAEDVESLFAVKPSAGCDCHNATCGCCAELDFPVFEYDHTGCVNVTYLPAPEYGIQVTFTFDKTTIINKTVSVRNPPPICFGLPYLKSYLSLCIDFYNMNFTSTSLAGCVKIQLRAFLVVTEEVKIGCFHIGPKVTSVGAKQLKWRQLNRRKHWGWQGRQSPLVAVVQNSKWKL